MLNLSLEGGLQKAATYYDRDNQIKFDPPVYEQRYAAVICVLQHTLWKGELRKITEFGCAEMKFYQLLKRMNGVEHIVQIDIDEETLKNCKKRVDPLLVDYLKQRETPLRIEIYKGSIAISHELLKNSDAVIGIEIIEHLEADVLEGVPHNIFGYIKPKIAIFTTPNSDFNVLFNLDSPNGFRHYDHKFEWNRKQFKDWCLNICQRYPNYQVAILGVGKGPPDRRELGCVSQMCVFVRKDLLNMKLVESGQNTTVETTSITTPDEYKLVYTVEYPFTKDDRTYEEKLLDDIKYHIGLYSYGDRWLNSDKNLYEIPLYIIFELLFPKVLTITELSSILTANGYTLDGETIVVEPVEEETFSNSDLEEYDNNEMDTTQFDALTTEDEETWD